MKSLSEIKENGNLLIISECELGCAAKIFRAGKEYGSVIWSSVGGWEHVSLAPFKRSHIPTWEEMCKLKDMFFYEDEAVVQYHFPKGEQAKNVPNCLHLWRPTKDTLPVPPSVMVGTKDGQSVDEAIKEIDRIIEEDRKEKCDKK